MVVILFMDLSGSTARAAQEGELAGIAERRERMRRLEHEFAGLSSQVRRIGLRQGDGWLFVAPADLAIEVFLHALRVQAIPDPLPARIALGLGVVSWDGEPFTEDATVDGTIVDLTARLLSVCLPEGVAVSERFYPELARRPEILARLARRVTELKGFVEPVEYYLTKAGAAGDPSPATTLAEVVVQVSAIKEDVREVRGELRDHRGEDARGFQRIEDLLRTEMARMETIRVEQFTALAHRIRLGFRDQSLRLIAAMLSVLLIGAVVALIKTQGVF
jgi:class 3 adenylate cyclase